MESIKSFASALLLRYELETCIYMLEPWEKCLTNIVYLLITCLLSYLLYSLLGFLFSFIGTKML